MSANGKPENKTEEDDYLNYEELEEDPTLDTKLKEVKKGSYAGIHSSNFRDFLLKQNILKAIQDAAFEHPSEVQQICLPQAIHGNDIICHAKSGMGKTAVFVFAVLQQLVPEDNIVDTLVLCHTREMAYQICAEFKRFSTYMKEVRVQAFFGGVPVSNHEKILKEECPHIVVGTPGRVMDLVNKKALDLSKLKRFIVDECDKLLGADSSPQSRSMRVQVQEIFKKTPVDKQVMMFTATLPKETLAVCNKFTQNAIPVLIDDAKLILHGLQQYYVKLAENQKTRKLIDLLDELQFNQVIIFVKDDRRCKELTKLLNEFNFPSIDMYGRLEQAERLERYNKFKEHKARILIATDVFARGVDFERVNIVINYDMPKESDSYLHRVGRSGRFGTKGLAVSFVSSDEDVAQFDKIRSRFEVEIKEMPEKVDVATYMSSC